MSGWFNDTQNTLMMGADCQKISDIWLIYQIIFVSSENIFVLKYLQTDSFSFSKKYSWEVLLLKKKKKYIYIYTVNWKINKKTWNCE